MKFVRNGKALKPRHLYQKKYYNLPEKAPC